MFLQITATDKTSDDEESETSTKGADAARNEGLKLPTRKISGDEGKIFINYNTNLNFAHKILS